MDFFILSILITRLLVDFSKPNKKEFFNFEFSSTISYKSIEVDSTRDVPIGEFFVNSSIRVNYLRKFDKLGIFTRVS